MLLASLMLIYTLHIHKNLYIFTSFTSPPPPPPPPPSFTYTSACTQHVEYLTTYTLGCLLRRHAFSTTSQWSSSTATITALYKWILFSFSIHLATTTTYIRLRDIIHDLAHSITAIINLSSCYANAPNTLVAYAFAPWAPPSYHITVGFHVSTIRIISPLHAVYSPSVHVPYP